ncbi:DUF1015 family protein [Bdellovibrionota bacterium FG-1]
MATLRPFRALRPLPQKAAAVSAVPYDVVNRDEAAALAQSNPLSFLHISRPEIDLDPKVDPYSDPVYEQARKQFEALKISAPLIQDSTPQLYAYRLRQQGHEQTGIAATFSVQEYEDGIIRRHERTRKDKEDDRTKHLLALQAQTGPAYLTYRGQPSIDQLIQRACQQTPLFDFTAADGVTHTLWNIAEPQALIHEFESIARLYIADGHHRTASAARAHAELTRQSPVGATAAAHAFFLAVAFPAAQLRILPYHRVVLDLAGLSLSEFKAALEQEFSITPDAAPAPARGEFSMFLNGGWLGLRPRRPVEKTGIASLDVSVLQERLLAPILKIEDPRTSKRIDFVGGIRGTAELEMLVNIGKAAVAFAVHPTTLEDLMTIADADEIMPPKSTWFEPKLRDGLLSHYLAENSCFLP